MKRICYSLLALGLVGNVLPAMADNNQDIIETITISKEMVKDGTNSKAIAEGHKNIEDFYKAHPNKYYIMNEYRDKY